MGQEVGEKTLYRKPAVDPEICVDDVHRGMICYDGKFCYVPKQNGNEYKDCKDYKDLLPPYNNQKSGKYYGKMNYEY